MIEFLFIGLCLFVGIMAIVTAPKRPRGTISDHYVRIYNWNIRAMAASPEEKLEILREIEEYREANGI